MRGDAWKSYEGWRGLWLSGGESNDIAALRFHGLRGALALAGAANGGTGPRLALSSSITAELPIADAVIAEAASQVRRLLCVGAAPGTAWNAHCARSPTSTAWLFSRSRNAPT